MRRFCTFFALLLSLALVLSLVACGTTSTPPVTDPGTTDTQDPPVGETPETPDDPVDPDNPDDPDTPADPDDPDDPDTPTDPDDPENPDEPVLPMNTLLYIENNTKSGYLVAGRGTVKRADITIPAAYNGIPIVGIAAGAFADQTDITSVKLPAGVREIGKGAFRGCASLSSITIPANAELNWYGGGYTAVDLTDPAQAAVILTTTHVDKTFTLRGEPPTEDLIPGPM